MSYSSKMLNCQFYPSCSNYFSLAIAKKGLVKGTIIGLDRIVMLLANKSNIREITLFPMNQNAEDLLMGAPSIAEPNQLKELNIKILEKKK